jgi:hypothetical protein
MMQSWQLCKNVRAMAERNFIVLSYERKVPAMAGCKKCQCKFFTPDIYSGDSVGAHEYPYGKFDHHTCDERPLDRSLRIKEPWFPFFSGTVKNPSG